jgi:general secretion pathway protein G
MHTVARRIVSCRARSQGFTLVELMVVLFVLAMLLAISYPRFTGSTDTAKQQVRAQNMATLRDALDKFHADQGRYPQDLAELTRRKYLKGIPLDPVTGSREWQLVADPAGMEPGVYDVAAPVEARDAQPAPPPESAAVDRSKEATP